MISKEAIRKLVDNTDQLSGKVFTYAIQFLIVVSLVTFSIDTLPDLSSDSRKILYDIEFITVTIFTVEYLLRIVAAENKARFIFSFYDLVDLIAILPFYISSGLDLRALRIFRLFRLVRILKLFRYNQAVNRLRRAMVI